MRSFHGSGGIKPLHPLRASLNPHTSPESLMKSEQSSSLYVEKEFKALKVKWTPHPHKYCPTRRKAYLSHRIFSFHPQGNCNHQNCPVRSLIHEPWGEIMVKVIWWSDLLSLLQLRVPHCLKGWSAGSPLHRRISYIEDGEILAEIAWRGGRCSIPRKNQGQVGQSSEQPGLVKDGPAYCHGVWPRWF